MMEMHLTSKGQVTIPKMFREAIGVKPGGEVEFHLKKGKLYIQKSARKSRKKTRGQQVVEALTGKGDGTLSTEEIMRLTRDW